MSARGAAHAHRMVAKAAAEMAGHAYELIMKNDVLFKAWKSENPGATAKALETRFISKFGECYLEQARATLAGMLAGPYDEVTKAAIHEALILDATLMKGRDRARSTH